MLKNNPEHPDRFDHWYQVLCEESVCAVTGRLSGVVGRKYQCHIRASAERDGEVSVALDVMISPGV